MSINSIKETYFWIIVGISLSADVLVASSVGSQLFFNVNDGFCERVVFFFQPSISFSRWEKWRISLREVDIWSEVSDTPSILLEEIQSFHSFWHSHKFLFPVVFRSFKHLMQSSTRVQGYLPTTTGRISNSWAVWTAKGACSEACGAFLWCVTARPCVPSSRLAPSSMPGVCWLHNPPRGEPVKRWHAVDPVSHLSV